MTFEISTDGEDGGGAVKGHSRGGDTLEAGTYECPDCGWEYILEDHCFGATGLVCTCGFTHMEKKDT